MTAITPLTTGFHEITPLTMKSERCYNQPPCTKITNFGTCWLPNFLYKITGTKWDS